MDHYIEINILPDPEFTPPTVMNVLFGKLHAALVSMESDDIGVSFPEMGDDKPSLGSRLRLHGTREKLSRLASAPWLAGMADYIRARDIAPVPPNVTHRIFRRVQTKSNPQRLRRRMIKRKGVSQEEAQNTIPDSAARFLKAPFVRLKSSSTGQNFLLFIEQTPPQADPAPGAFSRYGLSQTATVPCF